ncbi:ADP-ribose mitochondrial [Brachionus plicatilis]|uniref:ADP-ribose mitochondrial n=1 Tax=Brachionus plicatilis TaxID=10195 RepID=A0A3M7PJF1_BRAPC|nr:ADP-ribose mitochondrial [Brachionus plicatilis]
MTEKLFVMVDKNSPNFKACPQQKESSKQKKVIAYLTLPCEVLDGNSTSSNRSNCCQIEEMSENEQWAVPNHLEKYAMTLITKFKWYKNAENCTEFMVSKTNRPFVEILAFKKHSSDKYWMIPSGHSRVKNCQTIFNIEPSAIKCAKKEDLSNEKYEMIKDFYKQIFINSKIIFRGYLNDGRKKKNSLIEVIAENCHHFNDNIIALVEQAFRKDFSTENYCLKWLNLYDQNFYPPHRIILKKCANFLNAEWID